MESEKKYSHGLQTIFILIHMTCDLDLLTPKSMQQQITSTGHKYKAVYWE